MTKKEIQKTLADNGIKSSYSGHTGTFYCEQFRAPVLSLHQVIKSGKRAKDYFNTTKLASVLPEAVKPQHIAGGEKLVLTESKFKIETRIELDKSGVPEEKATLVTFHFEFPNGGVETKNMVVDTDSQLQLALIMVRQSKYCKGMEVTQQGDYRFKNDFTVKKVFNAAKKMEELVENVKSARERNQFARKENLHKDTLETTTEDLKRAEKELMRYGRKRLTQYAYSLMKHKTDIMNWEEYRDMWEYTDN